MERQAVVSRGGALLAWGARLFLAGIFIIGGLQKIIQTVIGGTQTADSIGREGAAFFGAMSQMEAYWTFIGVCEIGASLMLFVPRLSALGALAMFAIASNAWMVTLDLLPVFRNTLVLNSVSVLAVLFLLFRERERIAPLLTRSRRRR